MRLPKAEPRRASPTGRREGMAINAALRSAARCNSASSMIRMQRAEASVCARSVSVTPGSSCMVAEQPSGGSSTPPCPVLRGCFSRSGASTGSSAGSSADSWACSVRCSSINRCRASRSDSSDFSRPTTSPTRAMANCPSLPSTASSATCTAGCAPSSSPTQTPLANPPVLRLSSNASPGVSSRRGLTIRIPSRVNERFEGLKKNMAVSEALNGPCQASR